LLFISNPISSDLFPKFIPDFKAPPTAAQVQNGFSEIFAVHGESVDYAKMMFWSFIVGFSESFMADIISKFENDPGQSVK